ncbi:hypothetical protein LguiA_010027 [Lonicera macranthoides]
MRRVIIIIHFLEMWMMTNWECLTNPFLALAVEQDGFPELPTSAGVCVPIDVVRCHNSLLWKVLYHKDPRERSGLAANPIVVSTNIYDRSADRSARYSALAVVAPSSASAVTFLTEKYKSYSFLL